MRESVFLFIIVLGLSVCPALGEDPVSFGDADLKVLVEQQLGKSNPTSSDMLSLTTLSKWNGGISDLTGLEYAKNLTYLFLPDNQVGDLSPLSGLTQLTTLNLDGNQITSVSALSGLTKLTQLSLFDNTVTDIGPLSGLVKLTGLTLTQNRISDVSAVAGLVNLTRLEVSTNPLSDVSPLSGLTRLTYLGLSYCQISDISALSSLTNLRTLSIYHNPLSDISALAGLSLLNNLSLSATQVRDISVLSGLALLEYLDLAHANIRDISPLAGLRKLKNLSLVSNPLNNEAYCTYLPTILANNPSLVVWSNLDYPLNNNPPEGVSASKGTYPDKVRITWDDVCSVLYDSCYIVYRSNSPTGTKTALCDWQLGTAFDDTTALPEVTYHYWVKARVQEYAMGYGYTDYSSCDTGWRGAPVVTYALTASSGGGGSVTAPGEGTFSYAAGSSVSVVAVPAANHRFTGWTGTAVSAGKVANPGAASTTVTMDEAYTLVANFEATAPTIVRHTLTVSSGDGGSVVTPGQGAFTYDEGMWVWITAQADSGYRFTGWTGTAVTAGKVANRDAVSTTVFMDADYAVAANFEVAPVVPRHTLTVLATEGGRVSVPGVGSFTYDEGATVSLCAKADADCQFSGWTGAAVDAGKVADPSSTNTFVTMGGDYSLCANFVVAGQLAVLLVSPNGGEALIGGSIVPVRWQVKGDIDLVDIELSLDGGSTWTPLSQEEGAAGTYEWLVPTVEANRCLIRVKASQNAGMFDVSSAAFTIRGIVRYVDAAATGAGDGGSWQDAFISLQDALAASSAGDGIYIAQGLYWPDLGAGRTFGDRTASFRLKNRVAIYGGFPTGGGTLRQRNPLTHRTILSGDLGEIGVAGDNSFHVVTSGSVGSETILDGCVITGGFANGAEPYNRGGGMYNEGNPVVRNCTFVANAAVADGGGAYNSQGSPTFINCVFNANTADDRGGGMCNVQSTVALVNCTLAANEAYWRGGGILHSRGSLSMTNTILWGNVRACVSGRNEQAQVSCDSVLAICCCCVQGWTGSLAGHNSFGSDPQFVDADGPDNMAGTFDDDLRLRDGSPCIDAGDNTAVPVATASDLQGRPRIAGDVVDVGAYEFGVISDE